MLTEDQKNYRLAVEVRLELGMLSEDGGSLSGEFNLGEIHCRTSVCCVGCRGYPLPFHCR